MVLWLRMVKMYIVWDKKIFDLNKGNLFAFKQIITLLRDSSDKFTLSKDNKILLADNS